MASRFTATLGLLLVTAAAFAQDPSADEAKLLGGIRQVTRSFPRAGEGYFSPDGTQIVYQAYPLGYPFYQIYTQPLEKFEPRRVSPGRGRTTCAYFSPDGKQILFASAHSDPQPEVTEKFARDEAARGGRPRYQWDFDPNMELYVVGADGLGMTRLTDSPGYDAEGSYSHDGKQIVFTSTRDGDADIYVMNADGSNVRQITNVDGYDGGPFFSPDDKWILYRTDRKAKDMLQVHVISTAGEHDTPLTDNTNQVNWAPYFHPNGNTIIWTGADYSRGPMGANFDLWTMEIDWKDGLPKPGVPRRVTTHPRADVLPVFSPDGTKLMWTSGRTDDGSSQLYIADWLEK
ncbi:translocation protein TolB [Caulifigura coniformis]|uniref:Translocation protein TolB n=1 Tax=Caulifigura coniformis TaxID=2527983 RepID=A0A517SBB0_9PLAN|nr:PD40 domain-containing protein [Caulifigura coniformis]QDT53394.1 translocation protein TolB [Caulifigura coniformis]